MHAGWKKGRLTEKRRMLVATAAIAAAFALAIVLGVEGGMHWLTPVAIALGAWIILSSLVEPLMRLYRGLSLSRSVLGMSLAHIGLGVFVLAVTAVETYTVERDVALRIGESARVGSFEYRLESMGPMEGPNYDGVRGVVVVSRGGRELARLRPEKRQYWVQKSVMTEAGIASDVTRNIFAAIGEDLGEGKWSIRAQVRPFINYVWLAAFLMAIGGGLAASDRRYQRREAAASTGPEVLASS
jgi:cytochrome c-type biogenesis protein CcmF